MKLYISKNLKISEEEAFILQKRLYKKYGTTLFGLMKFHKFNPEEFLDFVHDINLSKLKHLVKGIVKGCDIAGCKLVGGETAEMPGTYTKGKFDIAGFSVGLVEKKKILNKKIRNDDLILAVPSNGLHSNGYYLFSDVLKKKKNRSFNQ